MKRAFLNYFILQLAILLISGTSAFAQTTYHRCGGAANYTDQSGIVWGAENLSNLVVGTSSVQTYTAAVAGTTDDVLYQTQRQGSSFGYAIPVPNGTYNIGVWYSELGYTSAGNRNFSVSVEGVVGVNGFDPWAAIGGSTPFRSWYGDWNFSPPTTTVTDGVLNINFSGTNAICQGIQVVPLSVSATATPVSTATATRTPTQTPTRTATPANTVAATNTPIPPTATATSTRTATPTGGAPITSRTLLRCGGTSNYLDQSGTTWRAESVSQLVAGTSTVRSYTTAVAGTTDDALYQTQREGSSFGYAITVPNGTYNVGLWYSELGYVAAGNRSFSVSVEGVVGVNGFDPWSAIGSSAPFRSWYGDWNFSPPTTTVNDGVLNINFSGTNAICQGIEIIPLSVSATATPTGTATATRTSTSTTTPIATATRTNTPVSTAAATNTPLPPTATSTSTATRTATPTGSPPITSRTLLRCGGTTNYLDQSGTTWRAESLGQLVAGTSTVRNYTTAVAGTTDDALYQTQREGSSFGYAIPVPNGTYNVGLWYSELGYVAAGNRSFSVSVEGVVGVNGFDPWSAIGSSTPFRSWYGDWNFSPPTTTVSDGILNINFSGTNAICQGIEIIPLSVSATATPTGTATQTAISTTAIATATATRTSTATTIPVAPTATATRTATSTTVATNTVVAPTATATRTNTATPPAGSTATATPTRTATPTATFTSFPAEVESVGYNTISGKLTSYASGSNSITYSYSTTSGNLQGATWASGLLGNTILSYTFQGSLPTEMSWSGNVAGRVGVTYNNNLEIVSQTVNGANSVALTYDRDGLLKTAGAATNTYLATNGLLSTIAVGSTTETFSYNTFGEITSHQVRYGTTTLYSNTVAYDKGSRITSETEVVQSSTNSRNYGYDLQDRLTSVAVNGGAAKVMTYDDAGNRTSIGGLGALFDNQDRLLQNDATLQRYSYNNKGDLSAVRSSAGALVAEYDYDIMGSLNGAVLYNNPSARRYIYYLVDAAGRRVGKKVGSTALLGQTATPEKRWLYQDGLHPVAELDSSGALLSRFVYGVRGNVPAYMVRGGVTYRIVADHLGSVRLVVNAGTGVVSQRIEYDNWGNVLSDTNPGFQPFGFAGGLYDQDTKLVRFGARDYDPAVGRWVTKDPIRFDGGINLYAYAANNPVNLVDPDGRNPILVGIGIAWAGFEIGSSLYDLYQMEQTATDSCAGTGDRAYSAGSFALGIALPGSGQMWMGAASKIGATARGYRSFNALKKAIGPAGKGRAWHHIVEKNPADIQKFGNEMIHSLDNVINLPHGKGSIHAQISGYYSSIQPFSGGQTVRQWLHSKSFQEQYNFGIETIVKFGGTV